MRSDKKLELTHVFSQSTIKIHVSLWLLEHITLSCFATIYGNRPWKDYLITKGLVKFYEMDIIILNDSSDGIKWNKEHCKL